MGGALQLELAILLMRAMGMATPRPPCGYLHKVVQALATKLSKACTKASSASWRSWVRKALKAGGGKAHRFTNKPNQQQPPEARTKDGSTRPMDLAEEQRLEWGGKWSMDDALAVQEAVKAIRALWVLSLARGAGDLDLDHIFSVQNLRRVLASFASKTVIGCGMLAPHDLLWLPEQALGEFGRILIGMVQEAVMPLQLLQNWMVLLQKKLGGFRTIGKMPTS